MPPLQAGILPKSVTQRRTFHSGLLYPPDQNPVVVAADTSNVGSETATGHSRAICLLCALEKYMQSCLVVCWDLPLFKSVFQVPST